MIKSPIEKMRQNIWKEFDNSLKDEIWKNKLPTLSPEQISVECTKQYASIKIAEEKLRQIRQVCKHEHTFEGDYSWRPGAVEKSVICTYCHEVIKKL